MAIKIKPFVFRSMGWSLTAEVLDGNYLRARFPERDKSRFFEYSIETGILSEVKNYVNGPIKEKAEEYVEVDPDLEYQKELQMQFGGTDGVDFRCEFSVDDVLITANLMRWLRSGCVADLMQPEVQAQIQRFTNQTLDADRLIKDLKTFGSNIDWAHFISKHRYGDGFQLNGSLEEVIMQEYGSRNLN